MTKMLSLSAALFLTTTLTLSAGEKALNEPPSILNVSRTIFRSNDSFHQFKFRGGVVNFWPSRGAQWSAGRVKGSRETFADASRTADLPNGCLVYACARAEQIRLHPRGDESLSRVIAYRRADGSGHAFVLFKRGKTYVAEDNSGNTAVMPAFENRSASEALYMARNFQNRTAAGYFAPVQASFIGKF